MNSYGFIYNMLMYYILSLHLFNSFFDILHLSSIRNMEKTEKNDLLYGLIININNNIIKDCNIKLCTFVLFIYFCLK